MLYYNNIGNKNPTLKRPLLNPLATTYNMNPELAHKDHDHSHCIQEAVAAARNRCEQQKVRFTPQRESVFRLLWESHKPMGAYTILEKLSEQEAKNAAPPTVYRALDFLAEQGLIHHLRSINAWLGCRCPENHHHAQFFICEQCHQAMEITSPDIATAIQQASMSQQFAVTQASVEVLGLCPQCQQPTAQQNKGQINA